MLKQLLLQLRVFFVFFFFDQQLPIFSAESFKICPRSAPGRHRAFQKTEAVLTLSQQINVDEEDDLRNYKSDCLMLILWKKNNGRADKGLD